MILGPVLLNLFTNDLNGGTKHSHRYLQIKLNLEEVLKHQKVLLPLLERLEKWANRDSTKFLGEEQPNALVHAAGQLVGK